VKIPSVTHAVILRANSCFFIMFSSSAVKK